MLYHKIATILLCSGLTLPLWAEESMTPVIDADAFKALETRVLHLEQIVNELKQSVQQVETQLHHNPISPSVLSSPDVMASSPLVTLESWQFREVKIKFNTYYALDLVLNNGYDKAIKDIDARVNFRNLLGGHLYGIAVTEHLRIAAQSQITDEGTQRNGRLLGQRHQMLALKNDEIAAELVVRKIVFEDNSTLSF
ncbi:hypothetical protein [Thioflexithrix psekupsensis]|uniref:Uncharacterized protein n=1 Tax=Thioflexithrix psekupsensis TaxID=1570016 RepID=A0A251X8J4_9GAMM|nr:hypothetical protein [Thioflexithrix psekupsensis]OUD13993.1 hypothetical protein TPSD3_06520 [Thioflexithrix psekupsensis]